MNERIVFNKIELYYIIKICSIIMSKKQFMNENFCKRSTKKDKKKNTENKFGKHTQRHVRKFETYKKKTETKKLIKN